MPSPPRPDPYGRSSRNDAPEGAPSRDPSVPGRVVGTDVSRRVSQRSELVPSVVARLPPALVDWSGAANYLATTDRHVRELVARGEIAVVKVGRLVRLPPRRPGRVHRQQPA